MTKISPRTTARLRLVAATALAGVASTAVVGLGYAAANGPASASQYQYKKTTICHHTGSQSNPHRTITVSSRAVPAHMRHGDTPGPCPARASVMKHGTAAHVKKFHRGTTLGAELRAEKAAKAKKAKEKAGKEKPNDKGKGKGGGK